MNRRARDRGDAAIALLLPALALVAALAWRWAYLDRLGRTPLLGTLRGDEKSYWDWATYLLNHHFVGSNPFFQGPLYPYVLASLRAVAGSAIPTLLHVQAFGGAAAIALLVDAVRRTAGARAAAAVGVLLLANTMWVFFDGLILSEPLLLLLHSAWIWMVASARGRPGRLAVAGGILIGLMAQCRGTELALLPIQLLVLRSASRERGEPWRKRGWTSFALCAALILPSALWNEARTHSFIPLTYNGGFNFYVGNNPDAQGTYRNPAGLQMPGTPRADAPDGSVDMDGREYLEKTAGVKLSESQSSTYWTGRGIEFARRHPGTTLLNAGRKALLMVNREEAPQIERLVTFERLAGPVGLPLLGGFGVLGVLGIAGACTLAARDDVTRAARGMVLAGILATVPFFVTDRYRVQLVPALAVLAAVWLRGAAVAIRLRDGHRIGVAIGAGLLGVAVTFIPLHAVDKDYEDWLSRADLGVRWLEVGNTPAALESFRSAVGMEAGLTADSTVASLTRADRAELHFNYGVALRRAGHMEDALLELETAARIDPTNAHYVRTLGDAALVAGRTREADSLLARVPRLVGGEAESALSEGYRAARSGHLAAAERSLRAAALADARLFGAWGALITVQVLRNENDEAERTLRRAADAGMPNVSLAIYDGLVGAARGDTLRAARSLTGGGSEQLDPNLARALALTRAIVRGEVRRPVPEP